MIKVMVKKILTFLYSKCFQLVILAFVFSETSVMNDTVSEYLQFITHSWIEYFISFAYFHFFFFI